MPKLLSQQQEHQALQAMREYLATARDRSRQPPVDGAELDRNRRDLIGKELLPLLSDYLAGKVDLSTFKSQIDGINKRNELWGFKGIKGQMFFNMLVNVADSEQEVDKELKAALLCPKTEDVAASRIAAFASFATRVGEQALNAGGSKHSRPKVGSVPFFVSYFWQIQDEKTWPVYYTNSVSVMTDLNLWQPTGELAADYVTFKQLHEELATLFTTSSGEPFDLYRVEHVFWTKGGNPRGPKAGPKGPGPAPTPPKPDDNKLATLPDSYVPPVVAILPRLARNDSALQEAAKRSGTSIDRAFEKSIDAAFKVLGYETRLLGQGQGRVPDGLAISADDYYAILWDAKSRAQSYSMGTDDRTIRDYIARQSRELKRRGSIRNIYYGIVSSGFAGDFDDAIRSMKMDTDIKEVCLIESEALVEMVDAKMHDPRQVTLGPDGLQRLFSDGGILTGEMVRTMFK